MKHDSIVELFEKLNLFDVNFWDKTQESPQREHIKAIMKIIEQVS